MRAWQTGGVALRCRATRASTYDNRALRRVNNRSLRTVCAQTRARRALTGRQAGTFPERFLAPICCGRRSLFVKLVRMSRTASVIWIWLPLLICAMVIIALLQACETVPET